ncbi:23S rRNA (guanosine2251-2'-O)-methyltransferase [Methylosinus sp. sav-2]|uniref:23S rRNA (guanosine(2251)-2'-O)-methyltransferase RlmB n=1 Tax=Methylosinus sp. sav-2 TaxID=2485168 RepID=UPI0004791EDD|nr:23S rRNA (guanosine(2251)-2'-O)-methyltransferase RlmB [Methylosinus sp. sav-2]TDX63219.1 23S rRNA (guanosine2251-2'-O)-methyltransferase [Methylosinus sp. sav-2]
MSRPPAGKDRGRRLPPPRHPPKEETPFRRPAADVVVLYGAHAVREALIAGRRKLLALYATENAAERIAPLAAAAGLAPKIVDPRALSQRLGEESVHQGLMLEARPLPEADIADIEPKSGLVLVLDQVTDPHNVGAILRTAAAFAVDALIVTERHSPDFTGVLAKAASGALEHVTIVSVVNLARALEQLAERDFLIVGLDSEGPQPLEASPLRKPLALVLGAEGKGLRRLTRERCDILARLDMPGPIKSLNVSNACAAALMALRLRLG